MNNKSLSHHQAEEMLIAFFRRNGCVRLVDEERREKLGQKYKKGYEVRLTANSKEELETMRQLLAQSGLEPGKPYQKRRQFVQPVYGKAAVDWFTSRAGDFKFSHYARRGLPARGPVGR